jgi:hypothetical protein
MSGAKDGSYHWFVVYTYIYVPARSSSSLVRLRLVPAGYGCLADGRRHKRECFVW